MDVATITMPATEARERLRAYRKQLHRKADAEFEAAAAGYEALAKGYALIDLVDVFRAVPRDARGRPKLAIARSDRLQVSYCRARGEDSFDSSKLENAFRADRSSGLGVRVQAPLAKEPDVWNSRGYALVPMVPADALATAGNPSLRECFTLWEVEQWADRRIGAAPDRDPFLLRHLHGTLYVVLAEWDLTDLERAIMAGRRDQR